MKKDVIYIDIEDDITGIIGKVKGSSAKIVALVPPKRIGVLQSVVNLKLLQKSAAEASKRAVLITNDHSLTSLAAGLKIPVAKNLQSRPEIPDVPALQVDDEEVIDGQDLPVGDIAAVAGAEPPTAQPSTPASTAADDISSRVDLHDLGKPTSSSTAAAKAANVKNKKKISIPNFNVFRKRFFLIGGGAVVLIAVLVWAFGIAPHATVTISAKTTAVNITQNLGINPSLPQSKVPDLQFKPNAQQIKKSVATDVTATGSKEIGNKASGSVTVTNSFDSDDSELPAGTTFTASSGQKFLSTAKVTVPGAKVSGGSIKPGTVTAQVQASDIGPDYNVPAQPYTISGYDSLSGSGSAMAGGDKQNVTVVSQGDVDKAKSQLAQQDANTVKTDLKKQLGNDFIAIDESFTADQGNPSVNPAVGEQAKQAKLTVETTYTLMGLARNDITQLLDSSLKSAVDSKPNQAIFTNGSSTVQFSSFQKFDGGTYTVRLATTGYVGSKVDANDLAKQVAGKRYGEIQAIVNQIPNVDNVDIKFSPFWVNSAPKDVKKIDIKFTILNDTK